MTDPDRYAKAVYEAALNLQKDPDKPHEPWESLPEWWRATFRREASAVQELIAAEIEAHIHTSDELQQILRDGYSTASARGWDNGLIIAALIARGEL